MVFVSVSTILFQHLILQLLIIFLKIIQFFLLSSDAETVNNKQKENLARYLTYFGFGVTTCIIFQRNVYVAAIIGLFVGAYIALSEYTIHNNSQLDLGPNVHFVDSSTWY